MKTETAVAAAESPKLGIKRILAPIDFSPASKKALDYAVRLSELFGAEVTLLHVLGPVARPDYPDIAAASRFGVNEFSVADRNLRALLPSPSSKKSGKPKVILRFGLPAHEIVEAAKELDADLIVIATHGYTGWKHFCIGSTAERVARVAPCPVLVVREREHDFA